MGCMWCKSSTKVTPIALPIAKNEDSDSHTLKKRRRENAWCNVEEHAQVAEGEKVEEEVAVTVVSSSFTTKNESVNAEHDKPPQSPLDSMHRTYDAGPDHVSQNARRNSENNQKSQCIIPTGNETVSASLADDIEMKGDVIATDNDVRIKVRDLLNLWDKNGFLHEIKNYTSTITGSSAHQLAHAITNYDKTADNHYLQKLRNKESYKLALAKSYAIFVWITSHISYNYEAKESKLAGNLAAEECSVEHVLSTKSTICQGYSNLFYAISQEAGLETVKISGHLKSFSEEMLNNACYKPFTPNKSNSHIWNAVRILDVWFPVDCTNGSAEDPSLGTNNGELPRKTNSFYFATPPEQLIYSHKPKDDYWQFLESPLSLKTFKCRIAPKYHYFKFGIFAEEQNEYLSLVKQSHVLKLRFKVEKHIALTAEIIPVDNKKDTSVDNAHLISYKHNRNGYIIISIIVPNTDLYCIQLRGCIKEVQAEERWITSLILAYFVQGTKVLSNNLVFGYPVVKLVAASKIQFEVLQWNTKEPHIAENDTGEMTIKFQCAKEVEIIHCLTKEAGGEVDHYTCTQLMDNDDTHAKYDLNVIFPETGLWEIMLYNKLPNNKKSLLMKYHVHAAIGLSGICYPVIKSDKTLLSPCNKIYYSPKPPNYLLKVPFCTTTRHLFTGYICEFHDKDKRIRDLTHVSEKGKNEFELNAVFPYPGKWEVGMCIEERISANKIRISDAFSVISKVDIKQCNPHLVYAQLFPAAVNFKITIPDEPIALSLNQHAHKPVCVQFTTPLDLIFSHHIVDSSDQTPLKGYTLLNIPDNKNLPYYLKAVFPHKGDWLIKLFATDDSKKTNISPVLSLHVNNNDLAFDKPDDVFYGFPKLFPRSTHQTKFRLLEWNKPEKEYVAENNTGTMNVVFSVKQDTDIDYYMVKGKEDNENQKICKFTYLSATVNEGSVNKIHNLRIIFSEEGFWTIVLMQSHHCQLTSLMEYTVYAKATVKGKCFPIITREFHTYGLQLSLNTIHYPSLYELPATATIDLFCPDMIKLQAKVLHGEEKHDASITKGSVPELQHVSIEINQCGKWIIELFACEQNSNTMYLVLRHEFNAKIT